MARRGGFAVLRKGNFRPTEDRFELEVSFSAVREQIQRFHSSSASKG
jgi:hypothetical protein